MDQELYLLIIRHFNGHTTTEEASHIASWLNESEEHRQLYNELQQTWEAAVPATDEAATEKALAGVHQRIRKTRFLNIRRIAAAAAVLIIMAASGFLFTRRPVNYIVYHSNPGQVLQVTLPDSTSVHLAPGATIKYREREISLEGEAFFNVQPNAHKPFTVHAGQLDVQVLGTRFNVSHSTVSLVDGNVKVHVSGKAYALQPGQELRYDSTTGLCEQHNYDVESVTGWTNRLLVFRNETLREAGRKIGQLYDVEFVFADSTIANSRLFARFENKSLEYILEVIKESDNLNYTIRDKIVYITDIK